MITVEALLQPLFSTEVSKIKLTTSLMHFIFLKKPQKENLLMLMTQCIYINIYSQENMQLLIYF